jgi:hypothetical protein
MVSRTNPRCTAKTEFTPTEIEILDHLAGEPKPTRKRRVNYYLTLVAKMGGYLARSRDPPPGNMVHWRRLSRLTDIHLGFELRLAGCG